MKRVLIGGALVLLAPAGSLAGERTAMLSVDRMTCPVCPITVTKAIKNVVGVKQVIVDFDTKRATVRYDDGKTTWRAISEASTNAGYPAKLIK